MILYIISDRVDEYIINDRVEKKDTISDKVGKREIINIYYKR